MRRVEFFFKETAAGVRRNGTAAFAAMSTAFIALFLFGLALLIARQFNLVIDAWTGNVQVAVYLTDPVKPDNVARLQEDLEGLPAVGNVSFEDKSAACGRFRKLFANQPVFLENVNCEEVIPASLRVNLADASQFEQVTELMGCVADPAQDNQIICTQPGVRNVADYRELLDRLVAITSVLSLGVLSIAAIMLISAIVLVANTLKMGMYARRKEIGIMRLVGATNWRIRMPFLIEGLIESLLGALTAVIALFLIKVLLIDRLRDQIAFVPLIKNADVLSVAPFIFIAAVFVAVIAGTIGMRRFLDV